MVTRVSQCNHTNLVGLLTDTLDQHQQTTTVQHLETCEACQRDLQLLAAEAEWWRDASLLSEIDEAAPVPPGRADLCDTVALEAAAAQLQQQQNDRHFAQCYLEPAADDPTILGRLGDYDILSVIGHGGMGLVLRGYERSLNRSVAIKMLSPTLASSGAARRRFAREAQAAAAVVHWHVVAIHSVHSSGRLPYLVMSYVAGESLQKRIDRVGALELRDVLRIGMQAARGLGAAHEQGLVHRDIKPANILLENDVDRVLLTDFGLARAVDDASLTLSGVIAGTPQYMSPEQARGEGMDTRADLFSLGAVLYTMCTGRPPFRAETTMGILHKICSSAPHPVRDVNADVPPWLEQIIQRLLAKSPADRYQTAEEVAELLGQCLAHVQHPTANQLPESLRPVASAKRRWRRVVGIAVLTTILLVTGMAVHSLWQRTGGERTEQSAAEQAVFASTAGNDSASTEGTAAMPQGPSAAETTYADVPSAAEIEQQLLDIEASIDQLDHDVILVPDLLQ